MKPLKDYIANESNRSLTQRKCNQLYKGLLIDDRERIEDISRYISNPSFEDIKQLFWKGAYKDRVDEYFDYITSWLEGIGLTPKDIVHEYSLARSGKQMKIEVIATVIRFLISFCQK